MKRLFFVGVSFLPAALLLVTTTDRTSRECHYSLFNGLIEGDLVSANCPGRTVAGEQMYVFGFEPESKAGTNMWHTSSGTNTQTRAKSRTDSIFIFYIFIVSSFSVLALFREICSPIQLPWAHGCDRFFVSIRVSTFEYAKSQKNFWKTTRMAPASESKNGSYVQRTRKTRKNSGHVRASQVTL